MLCVTAPTDDGGDIRIDFPCEGTGDLAGDERVSIAQRWRSYVSESVCACDETFGQETQQTKISNTVASMFDSVVIQVFQFKEVNACAHLY